MLREGLNTFSRLLAYSRRRPVPRRAYARDGIQTVRRICGKVSVGQVSDQSGGGHLSVPNCFGFSQVGGKGYMDG